MQLFIAELLEIAEQNSEISFLTVFGVGPTQGVVIARSLRNRFPGMKKHAGITSIILLILFSINAVSNVMKFSEPTKVSYSELFIPTSGEELISLIINFLGLNVGFLSLVVVSVTITIFVLLRFAELGKILRSIVIAVSVLVFIVGIIGRFTDYLPTMFQIIMYALYQFGVTIGIFLVARRKA